MIGWSTQPALLQMGRLHPFPNWPPNVLRQGRGAVCRVPAPKGHTERSGYVAYHRSTLLRAYSDTFTHAPSYLEH